ncbi:MAG: copper chaperone PCu(A)C [Methylacidiphilales bacterium]|nr:copper chaperone PCu(A)C [Candidatus Methylacidiphilales bacterium]
MRWRLIVVYSLLSLPFLCVSVPLWGTLVGMADGAMHPVDWYILLASVAVGAGVCLYIYRVWDFVHLQPYDPVRTPPAAKVGGGYLRITNAGGTPDRLIGFSTPVAGRGEIHEMAVVDGVMRMRELEYGIAIEPGQTVELKPGGLHVMFMDLKEPLKEGESVTATLRFEKAGTIEVPFQVRSIGARSQSRH